ncbi:unnamed protein product [Echinostoma caproni]|uniref:DRY_EERY domain-containing protein n=1 Tax=Echinostoma caproni TaxID=27848 RepID=A0A183AGT5_9TREM|nr:unnamed protein product [Echinostoma caproni]
MWQEARKQEKHIKTLMVDYKRRAERRRDYYERIKQDPIKFLRVYGRPAKLHLDSEVVKAAENPNNMMPWTGDPSILIDRFDARANLEHYEGQIPDDLNALRTQNVFYRVTEAMALKQIDLDEKYGDLERKRKEEEEASKRSQEPKAAIGFTYEDSHPPSTPTGTALAPTIGATAIPEDSDSDEKADSDMDIDVELDLATLSVDGRRQLAKSAASFGLHATDFLRLLDADQQLETELRLAKALEEEKLQLAGRKSRRARRILRERRAPDKFPKMLGTKRTVYLSASSSDSGEYPSDEDDDPDELDASVSPNSRAAALREQRAKAKPILTTARGPSVLIGGMTSIGLCRRRRSQHAASGRRSGSSSSSSSSTGSDPRHSSHHVRGGNRFRAGHRSSRDSSRRRTKRSRVEYITTFGDHEDDDHGDDDRSGKADSVTDRNSLMSGPPWLAKKPGTAATALAASVVSKLLGSDKLPRSSPSVSLPSRSSAYGPTQSQSGSRSQQQQLSRRRRSYGSRHHQSLEVELVHDPFRLDHEAPDPVVDLRSTIEEEPLHAIVVPLRQDEGPDQVGTQTDAMVRIHLLVVVRAPRRVILRVTRFHGSPTKRDPTPPVRRRYYRPELESDENSSLSGGSDEGSGKETGRLTDSQSYRHGPDSHNIAGKMMTAQSISGEHNASSMTKTPSTNTGGSGVGPGGVTPRITPQELLKRRVQAQLTKAFNADKKAELEKQVQLEQERQVNFSESCVFVNLRTHTHTISVPTAIVVRLVWYMIPG